MKKLKTVLVAASLSLTSLAGFLVLSNKAKEVKAASIPDGQVMDTIVDTISVSDLTLSASNGSYSTLRNQSRVPANINNDATFTFSNENVNKNLVFKFKYDVKDASTSSSNAVRIALDVVPEGKDIDNNNQDSKWNGRNSLWIRGDGTYFARYSGGWGYKQLDALTEGMHDIEYGRIAILDEATGDPTGTYYVFYKCDGQLIRDQISEYDSAEMDGKMFIQYDSKNTYNHIYDAAGYTYEAPQIVSVSDLKSGGEYVGNTIPDKQVPYTYDTTGIPTYKSTAFVAKVDYKAVGDSQLHLEGTSAGNWDNAGCGWLKQDNFVLYLNNDEGTASGSNAKVYYTALEVGSQHNMEYGRLAIMKNGEFQNRYHVYFKLDGKTLLSVDQAIGNTITAGGKLFVTGGEKFDYVDAYTRETPKEISIGDLKNSKNASSNTIHIENATEYTFDNTDHAENYSAVLKFKYEALQSAQNQFHLTCHDNIWDSASSFIINNDNGKKVHLGKSTATSSEGFHDVLYTMSQGATYNVEYGRLAEKYDGQFTGKYYTYLKINDAIVKADKFAMPEAVLQGNIVFITSDGKNIVRDVDYVDCAGAHTMADHYAGIAATCTDGGKAEYWYCSNCDKYFADEQGTTELTSFDTQALGHDYGAPTYEWVKVEGGYKCVATRVCSRDSNHKETEEVVGQYAVVTAATCTDDGEGKYTATFTNAAFEAQEKTIVLEALMHSMEDDEAVAATCTEAGHAAGQHCIRCDYTTGGEVIPALGHDYGAPTYEWVEVEGGYKCVATRVCSHDEEHKETEEVVGQYAVVTAATCEAKGQGKYTVSFENAAFAAQEKLVEIPATGHNYQLVAEVPAQVGVAGVKAHYTCEGCDKLFVKENEEYVEVEESTLVIPALPEPQSEEPSEEPSVEPSEEPSEQPSVTPSVTPSVEPSVAPSVEPKSEQPSQPAEDTSKQEGGKKKGCKGEAATSLFGLIALAGALILRKRR